MEYALGMENRAMKRLMKKLGQFLVRGKKVQPRRKAEADARISPARPVVSPPRVRPQAERPSEVRSIKDQGNAEIQDGGPGKNVLVRKRYVREETGTHEVLKIIDNSVMDDQVQDEAFDPYNTGRFDRADSWKNRTRK